MATDWSQYEVKDEPQGTTDWSQYEVTEDWLGEPEAPQSRVGLEGLGADIWDGVKAVPGTLWDMAKELPGEAYGLGEQVLTDPKRLGQNALAGLAQGGNALLNTPANIADYLARREFIDPKYEGALPRQKEHDFAKMLGLKDAKAGDSLIRGITEYFPYLLGGEAGALSKGARTLSRMGAAGTHAIGKNENPVTSALTVAALEKAPGAIKKTGEGFQKAGQAIGDLPFTPSGLAAKFGPHMSPDQLTEAMRIAGGTKTPLGNVIESGTLQKTFDNKIAPRLGSGADEIFAGIADNITQKGAGILEDLGGKYGSQDANLLVKSMLDDTFKSQKTLKNNLYNEATALANKQNFEVDLSGFKKWTTENAHAIEQSPLYKNDAKFRKLYKTLSGINENTSPLVDAKGKPLHHTQAGYRSTNPSISEAKLMANDLYGEGAKMLKSPNASDRAVGGLYKDLASKLKNDVNSSIERHGSPELKEAYNKAESYYKDDFVQFLDKDIYPLLQEGRDAQSIVREIIKPGKAHDKYTRIEKITELLPEGQKEILGYSYLRDALDKEGNLNPRKLNQLVDKLGPRQFQTLFSPETQSKLLDYSKLTKMNTEALNRMFNPKTGQRNATYLGGMLGATVGGVPGAALGAGIEALVSKWLTKKFTDEGFRNKVLDKKMGRALKDAAKKGTPPDGTARGLE